MPTLASNSATRLRTLELSRPAAVVGTVLVALVVNLALWLIGLAAGGSFEVPDGDKMMTVAPGGVITLTVIPALVGLTAAALLSYRWPVMIRVAQVVGPLLALGTIAMTIDAEFDAASTVALATMHVALAGVVFAGLEGLRRGLATQG